MFDDEDSFLDDESYDDNSEDSLSKTGSGSNSDSDYSTSKKKKNPDKE